MLIEFRTENHRSLREEQVITLEASRGRDPSDQRARVVDSGSLQLLPIAALYGANASGKSNLLDAFLFMRKAVLNSHRIWEPDSGVPRSPFAWGNKRFDPSMFEVTFLLDGTKYQYGFTVSDESVEEEWLFVWPKGRKQTWYEREGQQFKFGDHLEGENRLIEGITGNNALFLSSASQHRHRQLLPIYTWFRRILSANFRGHGGTFGYKHKLARFFGLSDADLQLRLPFDEEFDPDLVERFRRLLKASDIGIVDMKVVTSDIDERRSRAGRIRYMLQHQTDDEDSWLPLEEESNGTQTLIKVAVPALEALKKGSLFLVDELESSLHPLVAIELVRLFNSPGTNPLNAQMIFTTHDTNLLGTTLGEPALRRDQVWLTEKDDEGASVVYPLTDYKPRKVENLERGYLQGRYSSIPFLGGFLQVME